MNNTSTEKRLLDKKCLSPVYTNKVANTPKVTKKDDDNEKKERLRLQKKLHMRKVREMERTGRRPPPASPFHQVSFVP